MTSIKKSEQTQRVLQWGGLAGIFGSIVFIIVFAVVIVFVGADAIDPEVALVQFPEIQTARIIENTLYLSVLVLWSIHFVALFYSLQKTSLAPALFGSILSVLGLVVTATGALPHIATYPVSNLYQAVETTAEQQQTLILIWAAIHGVFSALLVTGFTILPFGAIGIGSAMLNTPDFGRVYGWATIGLGIVGLITAGVSLVNPNSPVTVITVFSMILFHFIVGWKVFRLSRDTLPSV